MTEQFDDPRQAVSLTRERACNSRKARGEDLAIAPLVPAASGTHSYPDRKPVSPEQKDRRASEARRYDANSIVRHKADSKQAPGYTPLRASAILTSARPAGLYIDPRQYCDGIPDAKNDHC
jgi:hypothetical protein